MSSQFSKIIWRSKLKKIIIASVILFIFLRLDIVTYFFASPLANDDAVL